MTLIYGKPKYKKQKSRHVSNPRITEYIPCEICGGIATETHEVFGASNRSKSITKYKAQIKLCKACHSDIHTKYSKHQLNHLKAKWQRKIMNEFNMTTEEFRKEFGKNYV